MCKYYSWWFFLTEEYEISEEISGSADTFFKFCYEEEVQCEVGRRNWKGVYDQVYYYNGTLEKVKSYHERNFHNNGAFRLIRKISGRSVILEIYSDFALSSSEIFNFDEKSREKFHCIFDADYRLSHYAEYFFDENDEIDTEKVFMPSIWKIDIEGPLG